MAVLTSTGTILSVSASAPATLDAAGFAALTYTVVGEVTNIPEFGPNVQVVTHEPLATGVTEKYKGFINYGSVGIEAAYDETDAGQIIMSDAVTGSAKNDPHSFKIEMQDGSIRYFVGGVFSYTENPGAANSMVACSMQLEINSVIVKVAAP